MAVLYISPLFFLFDTYTLSFLVWNSWAFYYRHPLMDNANEKLDFSLIPLLNVTEATLDVRS